jgi:hypothetical protein
MIKIMDSFERLEPLRHADGTPLTPDEVAEAKCDLSDICRNPKPRWTPYGEQDDNGVDVSLIRANLKLTPTQRLRQADRETTALLRMRRHARRIA